MPNNLSIGKQTLRFRKVTSENLKIGKILVTLANSNFQDFYLEYIFIQPQVGLK